jgi:hypothetical protein
MQNLSRAPEMNLGGRLSAAREESAQLTAEVISGVTPPSINALSSSLNGPHENSAASIRTGLQIIPSPRDAAAALQSSESQIARLQSNPAQPTARAASAAYQTEAAARTQISLPETATAQSVNVMA